ncbi:MAG: protease modulator HflC [Candidatus Altiarchaeota archaeon]
MNAKNKRKWTGKSAIVLSAIVLAFMLSMVFFIVDETENVVVTQFGKPVRIITDPGLYVKLPEPIQNIQRLDARLITSESSESEVLSSDKKNLVIDYYVIWRIKDPLKYIQTVGNEKGANYRISDIVYSEIRRELGLYDFKDIISIKRDDINKKVVESSRSKLDDYGMEIKDVKIRRINFPYQNLAHVFERMMSEREMMANKYRSEGEEEALKINAETDRLRRVILSEAYHNASVIKGGADAEAGKIYGQIYDVDPEFYRFMRTMEAYGKIIPKEDNVIITSSESEIFKYLKGKD